jgi:hypothetical protein
MQMNEKSLGEGEEALAEGALGPGAAEKAPWVYFCSQPNGRGTASPEQMMKPLQHQLKPCSYCREDGRDPISLLGHRCLGVIHPHRPWRQMVDKKKP